jgi:DNA-directed RNA polymerase specialized sigma24 family protein
MDVADDVDCGARSAEPSTDVNHDADAAPDRSIIVEPLGRLSPAYRQIVIETGIRRHTLQMTATPLDIPADTARSRLHHAMHELRRELDAGRVAQTNERSDPPADRTRPCPPPTRSTSKEAWFT